MDRQDALSERATAQELIRANHEAEVKENEKLKAQNLHYEEQLNVLRDQADRNMEAIAGFHEKLDTVSDKTHDTGVRIYRNVQAVIKEEQKKQTEQLTEQIKSAQSSGVDAEGLMGRVDSITEQMEDISEQVEDISEQTQEMAAQIRAVSEQVRKVDDLSGQLQSISDRTRQVEELTGEMRTISDRTRAMEAISGEVRTISDRTRGVEDLSGQLQSISDRTRRMEELTGQVQAISERTKGVEGVSAKLNELSARLEEMEKKLETAAKNDGGPLSLIMLIGLIAVLALELLQFVGIGL